MESSAAIWVQILGQMNPLASHSRFGKTLDCPHAAIRAGHPKVGNLRRKFCRLAPENYPRPRVRGLDTVDIEELVSDLPLCLTLCWQVGPKIT